MYQKTCVTGIPEMPSEKELNTDDRDLTVPECAAPSGVTGRGGSSMDEEARTAILLVGIAIIAMVLLLFMLMFLHI